MRNLTTTDHVIAQLDQLLRTSFAPAPPLENYPAEEVEDKRELNEDERRHAAGLMRINHTGEVCAQALYFGQAAVARNPDTRAHLLHAADEEGDHLSWCQQRLDELEDRPSVLNPVWYIGSFTIGAGAGLAGDEWSFGFVTETERQVEAHLHDHLEQLPGPDQRSRAIIRQMAADEARHGQEAMDAGGRELPDTLKGLMRMTANVMKAVAYRF